MKSTADIFLVPNATKGKQFN